MENYLHATERELIVAIQNGSEAAFRRLYEKYWTELYRIAYRRLPSEEDVKDILQETFISLWKNIDHFSETDNIAGYLYISLRNKIFNFYEKNKSQLKKLLGCPFNPVQSEAAIYATLSTKEFKAAINQILESMPTKMRQIYLLSKEEQLTNGEIAQLLMLAPQTVKNQIHQALRRIRGEFEKRSLHYNLFLFITLFLQ